MVETIHVSDLFEGAETVAGTPDGYSLSRAVVKVFEEKRDKVQVDFDGIIGISDSAACAFWGSLIDRFGSEVIGNLTFFNSKPSIIRVL